MRGRFQESTQPAVSGAGERSALGVRFALYLVSSALARRRPERDGVSLPGVPTIIIGHNERIAWGVTNLGFDVQDLYMERIDPGSGRYTFRGQAQQARLETERIPVKGQKPRSSVNG